MSKGSKFDGIAEKLERAKENIFNLDSEIVSFFNESDYPFLPEHDRELLLKAIEYHQNLPIPPRFAVLTGEIIHHLRSCLDHIAWHFSVGPVKNIRKIEFPIFDTMSNSDSRRSFEGKIEGITNQRVRDLIERFQPYKSPDPLSDPLWIIHDFDILDKHRELIVCAGTASRVYPIAVKDLIEGYRRAHPDIDPAKLARHFKNHGSAQPCISFRNFGGRKLEPVIPGLTHLFNHAIEVIKMFDKL